MEGPILLTDEDILEAISEYIVNNKLSKSKGFRVLVANTAGETVEYIHGKDLHFIVLES